MTAQRVFLQVSRDPRFPILRRCSGPWLLEFLVSEQGNNRGLRCGFGNYSGEYVHGLVGLPDSCVEDRVFFQGLCSGKLELWLHRIRNSIHVLSTRHRHEVVLWMCKSSRKRREYTKNPHCPLKFPPTSRGDARAQTGGEEVAALRDSALQPQP